MRTRRTRLKVKRAGLLIEISTRDLVALIIMTVILSEFVLMAWGRMEEAERMALFASGYGLGYLLERLMRDEGEAPKALGRRRRRIR